MGLIGPEFGLLGLHYHGETNGLERRTLGPVSLSWEDGVVGPASLGEMAASGGYGRRRLLAWASPWHGHLGLFLDRGRTTNFGGGGLVMFDVRITSHAKIEDGVT